MSQAPPVSNDQDQLPGCLIPMAHRRLRAAHLLWHQALENYHNAERFRANLDAAIEALRNVTWALQKQKHAFADFDNWYTPWQTTLKEDPTAKWLKDARTTVVHKGELESYSYAEVKLITWRDEVLLGLKVPIETPAALILQNAPLLDLFEPPGKTLDIENASISIERRWSSGGLEGREILSSLAHVYGLLADLILNAHEHLDCFDCIDSDSSHSEFPSSYDRTGVLRCMLDSIEGRTERFKFSTREKLEPRSTLVDEVDPRDAFERYGFNEDLVVNATDALDPLALAEKFEYRAKRILRRDKYHVRMMFLRDGEGQWHHLTLFAKDKTEKHILLQLVASFMQTRGCDALIEISEVWYAHPEPSKMQFFKNVESMAERREGLGVVVATREGLFRQSITPFKRGPFGGIKLDDTREVDVKAAYYLQPVFEVWRKQVKFRTQGGRQSTVWEPDTLDLCPCGGTKRYGECCRLRITAGNVMESQNEHPRDEATVRAALAQYVIWIKQHTTAAMHTGGDFYEKMVPVDALALEGHMRAMIDVLTSNGKTDLILPQLRRLREVVGIPRIVDRLTAISSGWLFSCGRPEEAILELDSLRNRADLEDVLAISFVTKYGDLHYEEKKVLLAKSIELASELFEKHPAQLNYASFLSENGEPEEALSHVKAVIDATGETVSPLDRSNALILRWKITRAEEHFEPAISEMEQEIQEDNRHRNGMYLIDGQKHVEAERVLGKLAESGDILTKILLVDSRLQSGAVELANGMFNSIAPEDVPSTFLYPYAHITSLLVLFGGRSDLRGTAIGRLESMAQVGGEQDIRIKGMLRHLAYAPSAANLKRP